MLEKIKKILVLSLMIICMAALSACSSQKIVMNSTLNDQTDGKESYQIAMIMDIGVINDKSYNQGTWEGIQNYCEENNLTYKYYKSEKEGVNEYQKTIEKAIKQDAEVVICPGYLFETPVYNVQDKYPDVKFVLIDGEPHNEDYSKYRTAPNTLSVLFKEEQSGFLAGYAAVKDGNKKLGFMGGRKLPAVIRYGYGYLAGAQRASEELGVKTQIKYTYTGSFEATPEAQATAKKWYEDGTNVIFACGGQVGTSVMIEAEETQTKKLQDRGMVIGVDVDQADESYSVMTSAMKMLSNAGYTTLKSIYSGNFKGGRTATLDVTNDGVGIAIDTARFQNFTKDDYNKILQKIISGEINCKVDVNQSISKLHLSNLEVIEQ